MGILDKAMKTLTGTLLVVLFYAQLCLLFCEAEPINHEEVTQKEVGLDRDGKVLPVFQVVKFPNDICAGATLNGTCYTSEECSSKGGKADGSCASGFGVCCTFTLACGGSPSENQTYISQAGSTSIASPCSYTICPCSTGICRIRYDFTAFVLSGAVAGSVSALATAIVAVLAHSVDPMVGDCVDDQFSISGSGMSSPVICGTNTGYHMIVDADADGNTCQTALFSIGAATTTSRRWEIRATQYGCGDEDSAGAPGCLQYYTATSSVIQNFGWPVGITTVATSVTHLSNQHYDICIRRGAGMCYICYNPTLCANPCTALAAIGDPLAIAGQRSFGVGSSGMVIDTSSATGSLCTTDFLEIPGATTAGIAAIVAPANPVTLGNKICGRAFSAIQDHVLTNAGAWTVCSRAMPFRVGVNFDSQEYNTVAAASMTILNEFQGAPGGIIGFNLAYYQVAC